MTDEPKILTLAVRRIYYEQFLAGTKDTELRRHHRAFNARVFYPGRRVRLSISYNIKLFPGVLAVVIAFEIRKASLLPPHHAAAVLDVYPNLSTDTEIAMIKLAIER